MNRLSEFMLIKQELIKQSQDKKPQSYSEREIRDKLRSMGEWSKNLHRNIVKSLYDYKMEEKDFKGDKFAKKGWAFIHNLVDLISDLYKHRQDASFADIAMTCAIISDKIDSHKQDATSSVYKVVQFPSVSAFINIAVDSGWQREAAGKTKSFAQVRDYIEEIYHSINGTHGIMYHLRNIQKIDPDFAKAVEEREINIQKRKMFDAQSGLHTRNEIREFINNRGDELGVDNMTLDDWFEATAYDQVLLRQLTAVIHALKRGRLSRHSPEVRQAIKEIKDAQALKKLNEPDFAGVDQPPSAPLRLIDTPNNDKEQAQEEQATNQAIIIEDAVTPPPEPEFDLQKDLKQKPDPKDLRAADNLLAHLVNKNVIDLLQYHIIKTAINKDKNVLVRFKAMLRNGGTDVASMRTRCADFVKEQKEITRRENIRQNQLLLNKKPTNIEETRFAEFAKSPDEDDVDVGPKVRINTKNIRVEDPEQEALAEQEALEKAKKQANIANKLVSLAVRLENKYNRTIFKLADKIERKYSKLRG